MEVRGRHGVLPTGRGRACLRLGGASGCSTSQWPGHVRMAPRTGLGRRSEHTARRRRRRRRRAAAAERSPANPPSCLQPESGGAGQRPGSPRLAKLKAGTRKLAARLGLHAHKKEQEGGASPASSPLAGAAGTSHGSPLAGMPLPLPTAMPPPLPAAAAAPPAPGTPEAPAVPAPLAGAERPPVAAVPLGAAERLPVAASVVEPRGPAVLPPAGLPLRHLAGAAGEGAAGTESPQRRQAGGSAGRGGGRGWGGRRRHGTPASSTSLKPHRAPIRCPPLCPRPSPGPLLPTTLQPTSGWSACGPPQTACLGPAPPRWAAWCELGGEQRWNLG